MVITCWGSRGSIPVSGKEYIKYGGDTTCIDIHTASDDIIIVDAGTGIRELGNHITKHEHYPKPVSAEIFLTHTHLDHILGLPFFAPIYNPRTELKIYGPVTCEETLLKDVIGGQFSYRYFPVRQNELEAVRSGEWKLFRTTGALYNLKQDIGETTDVAADNPEVVARLNALLDEAVADLGDGADDCPNCRPVGVDDDPQPLIPYPDR